MKLNLTGLITGGAWEDGYGYATATAFARGGASAVAVADLHGVADDLVAGLKQAAAEAGRDEPKVLGCTVDIAQLARVRAMHDLVSQALGGHLDVVVNNAANIKPNTPFLDSDPDVYWRTGKSTSMAS